MNGHLQDHWRQIRSLFAETLATSFHFSLASVDADGNPHVTPIGSLFLNREPSGYFFEIFTRKMPSNFENNARVCVLAVPSRFRTWLSAMVRGRFPKPPGIRLYGKVGPLRPAKPEEIKRWRKQVRPVRFFKGHDLLWSKLDQVRDVVFDDWKPINLGETTRGLWRD